MLAVCRAAVLTDEKCLSVDIPLPKCLSESFGLATDDICHFTTRGLKHAEEVGYRIGRAFHRLGIRSHQTKRITGALDGTCIGIDLFQGKFFVPSVHKLAQLLHTLSLVVGSDSSAKVSPGGLAVVLGVCQWFDLLARPLLSVFFRCHAFARRLPQTTPQTLPESVQSELFLCLSLAPFWEVDLQRPWSPTVVATDASDACCFGICAATANTDHVRRLGRLCVEHQAMAVLNSSEVDAQTKTRSFRPVPFHLHRNKFRTVVSSRRVLLVCLVSSGEQYSSKKLHSHRAHAQKHRKGESGQRPWIQ